MVHCKEEDVLFWSRQAYEHIMLIKSCIDYTDERNRHIINQCTDFIEKWQVMNRSVVSDMNIHDISILTNDTIQFQRSIMSILSSRSLGSVYYAYMDHITEEMVFFSESLKREIPLKERLLFWLDVEADHAALLSHLIDPTEEKATDTLNDINKHIEECKMDLSMYMKKCDDKNMSEEIEMMRVATISYSKEFNRYLSMIKEPILSRKLKSVIHPVLIVHVMREHIKAIHEIQLCKKE